MIVLIIILLLILMVPAFIYLYPGIGHAPGAKRRASYKSRSGNFDGRSFHNIPELPMMTGRPGTRSDRSKPKGQLPVVKTGKIDNAPEGSLYVTWLGHSSILVQLGKVNILIDPVLTGYSSPVSFAGVKRFSECPVSFDDLPEIDVLLLSHDHYDHLDYQTVRALEPKVKQYIVPLGTESYLLGWGIAESKIRTMSWWEKTEAAGVIFTATPGRHFSGRTFFRSNPTLWCGYRFEDAFHSVYYTGDGAYTDSFKEIGEKLGRTDLMLVECGQYSEAWPNCHMFPEQSAAAVADVGADWAIPVHWGAFCLCSSSWDDSVIRISAAAEKEGIKIATPKIGERLDFEKIEDYRSSWWEGID